MRNKKSVKKLLQLIVPALALMVLFIVMIVEYHNTFDDEKGWTTEYFSMLTESCANETERMKVELVSKNKHAGSLMVCSNLRTDVMVQDFETIFAESEAEAGLVASSSGALVYGKSTIYNSFSETAKRALESWETVISDVKFCADGQYRFAVATPIVMSDGGCVTVMLVYPMAVLERLTDVPKMDSVGNVYILRSDGLFLTGRDSVDRWSDIHNRCSISLLSVATEGLAEFKDYSEGEKYFAFAKSLGDNGWYAYCAAPVEAIKQRTIESVGIFFCITVAAFIILGSTFLYYYFLMSSRHRRQVLDRKKFVIAARQSSRAVFEYNMIKDKFYLINDCEKISMPGGVDYLTGSMGMSYIYPQDRKEIADIVELLKSRITASATVRVSCFGGNSAYRWYYIIVTRLARKGLGSTYLIGILEDIDERKKEHIALLTKATTDGLTGLFNRDEIVRLINERLHQPPDGRASAFIIFDLDDFKGVNDTYGHDVGDKVLHFFSDKLKVTFRSDDIVGRLGGDEFVVYMTFFSDNDLVQQRFAAFAESISKSRNEDDDIPYISCSAGYVTAKAGDEFETLYKQADRALYRAKTIGKNCVVCGD